MRWQRIASYCKQGPEQECTRSNDGDSPASTTMARNSAAAGSTSCEVGAGVHTAVATNGASLTLTSGVQSQGPVTLLIASRHRTFWEEESGLCAK